MLSIVIPTLDEEKCLPLLLESIEKQDFKNYEIIVSDAGSTDKTVEIARNYGCKIILGGLPAKGRNEGAKSAIGDLVLFLDADVVLLESFLKKNLEDFEKKNFGVAIFFQEPRTNNKVFKFFFYLFYNWLALIFSKISLFGGVGILVRKSIHEKVGGFDESVKISEDVFYLKKACRIARFGILRSVRLSISVRRYEQEGYLKIFLKHFFGGLHTTFIGPVKTDIFKYKFGHHKKLK